MTRETKIGLLVGLAFIIVVAILLTDHTASTTDSKPASQSDIGDNVRQSVQTPQAQIPTRADLARQPVEQVRPPSQPPIQVVQPGAGNDSTLPPIEIRPERPADAGRPPVVADSGMPRGNDLINQYPEDLMAVGGVGRPGPAGTAGPAGNANPAPPVVAPKTYVAVAGDSVSRIAQRQMPGGSTLANCDALIKANPSMQAAGNPVILGKTYIIPSVGAVVQANDAARREPAPTFKKPPASTPAIYWYTVKENDNLWRIAARELGDGALWHKIKEINADVLNGGETVHANQRIRLPKGGASTASVN